MEIFTHHYLTLLQKTKKDFIKNIVDGQIVLWQEHKNSDTFSIGLSAANFTMEGDLALHFSCNAQILFTMSFTIAPGSQLQLASKHVIFIGGVQGAKGHLDLIKYSTKVLNDICPRTLLLEAIQAIAITLNISDIVGICAGVQTSSRLSPTVGTSYHDYDYLWQSHGGENLNDHFYRLAVPFLNKPLNTIKRSHRGRAQTRRRFRKVVMDAICQSFGDKCLIDSNAQTSHLPEVGQGDYYRSRACS